MKRVIGVIPARYESSRFPGKPLAKIAGREMILRVVDGARQAKNLNDLWVATDDERIAQVVEAAGVRAVMTSPDCPSGSDRIWDAIKNENCEVVVNIQGDEPLVHGVLVDALVRPLLEDSSLEMATLAHPLTKGELLSENAVKVVVNQKSEALYFSRYAIPYSRVNAKQLDESVSLSGAFKHIGMYAYRKEFLKRYCATPVVELERAESLEQLRALYLGARIKVVVVEERSWGVDTPDDVKVIEKILAERKK